MPKLIVNFRAQELQALTAIAPQICLHDLLTKKYQGIKEIRATANPHEFIIIPGQAPERPVWPGCPEFLQRLNIENAATLSSIMRPAWQHWMGKTFKWLAQGVIVFISVWINFIFLAGLMLIIDLLFPGVLSAIMSGELKK